MSKLMIVMTTSSSTSVNAGRLRVSYRQLDERKITYFGKRETACATRSLDEASIHCLQAAS